VGEAQSPPLSNGEAPEALVMPQDLAIPQAAEGAGLGLQARVLQEAIVAAPFHKTDLLAFGFLRQVQPQEPAQVANLRFCQPPQRHQGARQLELVGREQEIGLILHRIHPLPEGQPLRAGNPLDLRIVPRNHVGGAQGFRSSYKFIELQMLIALYTGTWRFATFIG